MKKLTYIISTLNKTGSGNILFHIIENLDREKFTPLIIVLSDSDAQNNLEDSFLRLKCTIFNLSVHRLNFIQLINKLNTTLKEIQPNIVHLHGFRPDFFSLFMYKKNIQILSTIHNYPFVDYVMKRGFVFGGSMAIVHLIILNMIKNITFVSFTNYKQSKQYLSKKVCSKVIQNGVKSKSIKTSKDFKKLRNHYNKIYISIGAFITRKNHALIIETFSKLKNKDSLLIILGDGPLLKESMKLSSHLSNIYYPGNVVNPYEYLNICDYYISASLSEGLPTSVIESLSMGKPVLLSKIPAHEEILDIDINAGLLYETSDELLKILKDINSYDYNTQAKAAKNIFNNTLNAKKMSTSYQNFYMELLNNDMKILILEQSYSSFHIELAKSLSTDIKAFVFNIGNIVYLKGADKTIVHKYILKTDYTDDDMRIVKGTKSLHSETLRKFYGVEPSFEELEYMAKYVSYLKSFLKDENIKLVLMLNDLRWQHSLAVKVCKELDVKYLITERGIFRPDTTTIEFKGVNAYSSLPKDKEFYKNYDVVSKELRSYKVSKLTNLKVNIKFAVFILLNKIGDIFRLNSPVKNKNYSLLNYIKIFIKQKFSKKKDTDVKLPEKYIFVPLQVNTDTQILVHSEFNNIQEFITKIETDFYSLDSDIGLVFKIHPMENGIVDYKFDSRSIVLNSNTNDLVKNSECVITINSTVGFEAIEKYKKVIVLGNAFFKIDGIAICSSKNTFKDDLNKVLNDAVELDHEAIKSFVGYLKYHYQVNGNLFNWSDETLEEIKERIKAE